MKKFEVIICIPYEIEAENLDKAWDEAVQEYQEGFGLEDWYVDIREIKED